MTRRYTVTNLKTGDTKEFTGGEEARKKALKLEDKWYDQGVDYTSELVESSQLSMKGLMK